MGENGFCTKDSEVRQNNEKDDEERDVKNGEFIHITAPGVHGSTAESGEFCLPVGDGGGFYRLYCHLGRNGVWAASAGMAVTVDGSGCGVCGGRRHWLDEIGGIG